MKISRKSLASHIWSIVILAVVLSSGLICAVSLVQARRAIREATTQRMIDIANCAAGAVDGDVLEKLRKEDKDSEEYKNIYDSLAVFRDNIETEYIYGVRKEKGGRFTFTVDPALEDPAEFGEEVVWTEALEEAGNGIPAADEVPYSDQWGTFYSAYSPVFDSKGDVAGIIAMDFSQEWVEGQQSEQTRETIFLYVIILVITLSAVSAICLVQIRLLTDPMEKITQTAVQYQNGDYSGDLSIDRQDELGVLSRALQSMATSLTEQIAVAENANRAKSDFLASMSHEIRTPINAMLGNNEMILRESSQPQIVEYSGNIKSAGRDLLGLVDEILAYSKTGEKQERSERAAKLGPRERFTARDTRILAVDDNPMNLQVFLNLVKRTGIAVDTAQSGDEGLKKAHDNKYDVLVFDHMMPEKDGIETLRELRANPDGVNASTPAICLTANAIPGARQFYLDAGFDDYLTKPVDPDELEDMLRVFISGEKIEIIPPEENTDEEICELPEELLAFDTKTIDTDAGIKTNGSVASYITMLKMFSDSAEDSTAELDAYVSSGDDKNYTIKVHALKSSLRIIGAMSLSKEAQRLEDAGKKDDRDYIRENHEDFISDVRHLAAGLSKIFAADEEAKKDKPEADESLMKEMYEKLSKAAKEMDCDGLESVFDRMKKYRIPESEVSLYRDLKTAADRFEYSEILELLG